MGHNFIQKKILIGVSGLFFLTPFLVFSQTGNHLGEQKFLDYHIEYLSPLGVTVVDETGISYIPSEGGGQSHDNTILPEEYFGEYPLYFAGGSIQFQVFIKNEGPRTYRNLRIETFQEFLNINSGQGEAMGSNYMEEWFLEKLGPGEEIVLSGEFTIPELGESGIDQTHLIVSHGSKSTKVRGQVIIEDFQAGLWCPF